MSTSEVVPVNPDSQVMSVDDEFKVDLRDMVLPRFKIAQALTKEVQDGDAKAGDIINSVTGESYGNTLEFVVLSYRKGQMFLQPGAGLLCRSSDGKTAWGDPEMTGEQGPRECATCPFRKWVDRTPPPCAETHNYLILLPETLEAGMLTLMKSGVKPAKVLNTMIIQARERSRRAGGPQVSWSQVFELTARKTENKKGTFYIPSFRPVRPADEGLLAYATEIFNSLSKSEVRVSEDEGDAGDDGDQMPTEF